MTQGPGSLRPYTSMQALVVTAAALLPAVALTIIVGPAAGIVWLLATAPVALLVAGSIWRARATAGRSNEVSPHRREGRD